MKDKFGREIKVGDVVVNGNKGECNVYVVRGFTVDRIKVDRVERSPLYELNEDGTRKEEWHNHTSYDGTVAPFKSWIPTGKYQHTYVKSTIWSGYKIIVTGMTEDRLVKELEIQL